MSTHSKVAGKAAVLDLSAKIGDDRGSTSPSTTDSSSISSSYSFGRSDSDNVNSRPRRRSRVQSMSHKSKGAQDFFGTTPPPSPLIRNVSGSGTPNSHQDFFGASDDLVEVEIAVLLFEEVLPAVSLLTFDDELMLLLISDTLLVYCVYCNKVRQST